MKIAMLYAFWEGEPWSTPIGFRQELIRRGHEVLDVNLYHNNGVISRQGEIRKYSIEGLSKLVNAVNQSQVEVDVLFHLDYGVFDSPAMDRKYFSNDMVWVQEAGDEPQSHRAQRMKAPRFDLILSPDWPCTQIYQHAGFNARWWTHCADTHIFHPNYSEDIHHDVVTTCGPRGRGLTEKIEKALGKNSFANQRYFWGEDYGRFLNKGNMVFQCSQHGEITRRIFEGMACGKMVITDRLPAQTHIDDLFTEGEDIVYYDNADDAIEKIRHYASNDAERERIARNGFEKVLAEHSVARRIDVFEEEVERCRSLKSANA